MEEDLLVSRRSIYDHKVNVKGYQLMFCDPQQSDMGAVVPDTLCIEWVKDLFEQEEMKRLLGEGIVLVPFNAGMLEGVSVEQLPKKQLIALLDLTLLHADQDLQQKVERLFAKGLKFAAMGVSDSSTVQSFYGLLDIVMLDANILDDEKLKALFGELKPNIPKIGVYDVKTHERFESCQEIGFHYFEGYFLNLPKIVKGQEVSSNRLTAMRLLLTLDDEDVTLDKVEELLSQDARLSYRLLRVVNSAAYGLRRTINSLREAIVYLGLQQIRTWASLVVLSNLDDKPSDLMLNTMIRAKMCEMIAEHIGEQDVKPFFTAGLFSTLDAMLNKPMPELIDELAFSDELREAILTHEGLIGGVLCNVIAYTAGNFGEIADSGIEMEVWRKIYLESLDWATISFNEMVS